MKTVIVKFTKFDGTTKLYQAEWTGKKRADGECILHNWREVTFDEVCRPIKATERAFDKEIEIKRTLHHFQVSNSIKVKKYSIHEHKDFLTAEETVIFENVDSITFNQKVYTTADIDFDKVVGLEAPSMDVLFQKMEAK